MNPKGLSRLAAALLSGLIAAACSATPPPPLQPIERRMFDPGGSTVITEWTAPGETFPRVVQASGYRSGMRLIDGVSLVFQVQRQRWVLKHSEDFSELERPLPGERLRLTQPEVDAPVIWQARFRHAGSDWSLAVTQVEMPRPEMPGVASESQHALDLVLYGHPLGAPAEGAL